MRRYPLALMLFFLGLGLVFLAGPRLDFSPYVPRPLRLMDDLDAHLERSEGQVEGLIPGSERTIDWAYPDHRMTPWALIYLHGFTASRGEIDPVVTIVSKTLKANTYYARLAGHGIGDPDAIGQATVNDWFHDAEEALAIGRRLGERVAVIGMSTGGTLALWLAAHHVGVDALTLVSPNFGPARKEAEIILLPWGPRIAEWALGPYMSWDPPSMDEQSSLTKRFSTRALFPMMLLVSSVRTLDLSQVHTRTLTLYSPDDDVVDPKLIERYVRRLPHPGNEVQTFPGARHILAGKHGDMKNTSAVSEAITSFLKRE